MKRLFLTAAALALLVVLPACNSVEFSEEEKDTFTTNVAVAERMEAEFRKIAVFDENGKITGVDFSKGELTAEFLAKHLNTDARAWRVWAVKLGLAAEEELPGRDGD